MADGFEVHLFTYSHDGARWTVEIPARDAADARTRLGKLAYATYDGVLVAKVPVTLGWAARAACCLQSVYRALQLRASHT